MGFESKFFKYEFQDIRGYIQGPEVPRIRTVSFFNATVVWRRLMKQTRRYRCSHGDGVCLTLRGIASSLTNRVGPVPNRNSPSFKP